MATHDRVPDLGEGWFRTDRGIIRRPILVSTVVWYLVKTNDGKYSTEPIPRASLCDDEVLRVASEGTAH